MTQAQINYLSHLEQKRHNSVMEGISQSEIPIKQQTADASTTTAKSKALGTGLSILDTATGTAAGYAAAKTATRQMAKAGASKTATKAAAQAATSSAAGAAATSLSVAGLLALYSWLDKKGAEELAKVNMDAASLELALAKAHANPSLRGAMSTYGFTGDTARLEQLLKDALNDKNMTELGLVWDNSKKKYVKEKKK